MEEKTHSTATTLQHSATEHWSYYVHNSNEMYSGESYYPSVILLTESAAFKM